MSRTRCRRCCRGSARPCRDWHRGSLLQAGQLCISIERVYVEKGIAEEFTRKFGTAVRTIKLGTAYDFSVDMGSLISEGQLKTVSGHVDDATAEGARIFAGGKARPDIGPLFDEPTVLADVTPGMDCAADETFGPLVSIYPVAEGEKIAARLRSGTVNVNEGYAFAWGSLSAPMGVMMLPGGK